MYINQTSEWHSNMLKLKLKNCEDFWIKELETLVPKGLKQGSNNI